MKKLSLTFVLVAILTFGFNYQMAFAQEEATTETTEQVEAAPAEVVQETVTEEVAETPAAPAEKSGHQVLLDKFIEGGAGFMSTVLICLIFGLAFSIERIISLTLGIGSLPSNQSNGTFVRSVFQIFSL